MRVTVNGRERDVSARATVADLIAGLDLEQSGIAVACNEHVVPRSAYAEHELSQGDRVEIIKAVAGG